MNTEERLVAAQSALFAELAAHLEAHVGACTLSFEKLLYWDPADPRHWALPSFTVKLGPPSETSEWRTWEHGVPELIVELMWGPKRGLLEGRLETYGRLGVREVLAFDVDAEPDVAWRRWILKEDKLDLVAKGSRVSSEVLELWFVALEDGPPRLATGANGDNLLPTTEERFSRLEQKINELRFATLPAIRALVARAKKPGDWRTH